MAEVTIYHNPRCSKSRQTLELLRARGIEPEIIEYLQNPPDEETLDKLLGQLGLEPGELMRTKEDEYRELGLDAKQASRTELLRAMIENPILIERPIVVKGSEARLGRPPEQILEIL